MPSPTYQSLVYSRCWDTAVKTLGKNSCHNGLYILVQCTVIVRQNNLFRIVDLRVIPFIMSVSGSPFTKEKKTGIFFNITNTLYNFLHRLFALQCIFNSLG